MTGAVDAHVHLWTRATDPQPWIDPATMAAIDRDFAPDDLDRMLAATGVDTAVVVQSTNSAAETRRLLAHRSPRIAGVVGWLDLTADAASPDDLLAGAAGPPLVGIRHLVHVEPDPGWLARAEVGRALDRLAAHDLGFDLVLRARHLPLATTVAAEHGDVRFVVDHLGGIAETDDDTGWAAGLRGLAAQPNTYAKISGLATVAGDPARLRRIVEVALDAFGPHRLMYGSDWPLAELGVGAVGWRAAVDESIGTLNAGERRAIMSGTAAEFYRLAP